MPLPQSVRRHQRHRRHALADRSGRFAQLVGLRVRSGG
jgi:hypothetical protein